VSLSHDDIAEILRLIDGSSLEELIVDTGDVKLVVRRNSTTGQAELADENVPLAQRPTAQPNGGTHAAPIKIETAAGQVEVVAPMVGPSTARRAPMRRPSSRSAAPSAWVSHSA